MSLHNKENWNRFIELRHLISCNPIDKNLLKQELRDNYYQQRINSLSDLKCHMSNEFEENFFGSSARRFFNTKGYKFSKTNLTVTAMNCGGERASHYEIVFCNDNLELNHI